MLYHHCDGYPAVMLQLISKAFRMAIEGQDPKYPSRWELGRAGKSASWLCAADPGSFEPESGLDFHGDIEWFYVVRCQNPKGGCIADNCYWSVDVYETTRGFWDNSDWEHLKRRRKGMRVDGKEDLSSVIVKLDPGMAEWFTKFKEHGHSPYCAKELT